MRAWEQERVAVTNAAAGAEMTQDVARSVGRATATEPRAKAKRNLALLKRRARAVVTYLIHKGIDAGRLEAVGYGEASPGAQ